MKETKSYPRAAFQLRDAESEITVAAGEEEGAQTRFSMLAHSGGIMDHWLFGKAAWDLSSLSMPKKRVPVLEEHERDRRVGYTDKLEMGDGGLVAEGVFLKSSPIAQSIQSDSEEGFPFEASIFAPPDEVQLLAEGESAEVNGQKLEGPGAIMRGARLREISFVALGQDPDTEAQALSDSSDRLDVTTVRNGGNSMADQSTEGPEPVELSPETLKSQHPAVYEAVFKAGQSAGEAAERARAETILAHAHEHQHEEALSLVKEGTTELDALKKLLKTAGDAKTDRLAAIHGEEERESVGSGDGDPPASSGPKAWAELSAHEKSEFFDDEATYTAWLKAPAAAKGGE